jgi:rhodanese-related sulfurtransferase
MACFFLLAQALVQSLRCQALVIPEKLAAQFYFREMTVLKVMFTGIVVAMLLVFLTSSLGLLDFTRVWVNPTYLWPGIVGGLIMGVGFIIGGFCPGTSIVALSTLKIDGIFFVLGVGFGVFLFGETVFMFEDFWHSSFMDRFVLPQWLNIETGIVVLLVVFMALAMFYAAEISEAIFGKKQKLEQINWKPSNKFKLIGSAVLVFLALNIAFIGQPDADRRWSWIASEETKKIESREIYVQSGELLELMQDRQLYLNIMDLRNESDFNLFHLQNAKRIGFDQATSEGFAAALRKQPSNTVNILVSNDEKLSTTAWKLLKAQSVLNLYVLENGINGWLSAISCKAPKIDDATPESLKYQFKAALGSKNCLSGVIGINRHDLPQLEFEKRVRIQKKKTLQGGCG